MTLTEVLAVLHAFDEAGCRYWFGQGGGEIVAIRGTIGVDEPLGENAAQHAVVEGPKLTASWGLGRWGPASLATTPFEGRRMPKKLTPSRSAA